MYRQNGLTLLCAMRIRLFGEDVSLALQTTFCDACMAKLIHKDNKISDDSFSPKIEIIEVNNKNLRFGKQKKATDIMEGKPHLPVLFCVKAIQIYHKYPFWLFTKVYGQTQSSAFSYHTN